WAPEHMDAPFPHGPEPLSLAEFCERVSLCEMAVQYRSRMAEVLASVGTEGAATPRTMNKETYNA
ncbi:MAG: hypothetical protein EBV02_05845, partial [Actinobacteria bacterium]|nr:hypothetical protein [Actinomycetota bacterium]